MYLCVARYSEAFVEKRFIFAQKELYMTYIIPCLHFTSNYNYMYVQYSETFVERSLIFAQK